MAPVSEYEVIVTRERGSWLADIPAVPGAHTFARSLAGLAKSVREVIILMADLDDDATPELLFTYEVSDVVVQEAVAVGRERRQTRELEEALMAHTSNGCRGGPAGARGVLGSGCGDPARPDPRACVPASQRLNGTRTKG